MRDVVFANGCLGRHDAALHRRGDARRARDRRGSRDRGPQNQNAGNSAAQVGAGGYIDRVVEDDSMQARAYAAEPVWEYAPTTAAQSQDDTLSGARLRGWAFPTAALLDERVWSRTDAAASIERWRTGPIEVAAGAPAERFVQVAHAHYCPNTSIT